MGGEGRPRTKQALHARREELSSVVTTREESRFHDPQLSSSQTSNDLLFALHGTYSPRPFNYEIVAQSAKEVQDIQNAPALSMAIYLAESGQERLLTTISIYSQRGKSRQRLRLFYMNDVALRIWLAMGKQPKLIGAQHRPPQTALLTFGVPFSE